MLRQHGEPIEADLQRYYGIDVRDVFRRPARAVRPLPDALATPSGQRCAGCAAGLLVGTLIVAPVVAAVVFVALVIVGPAAWRYERAPEPPGPVLTPRRVLTLIRQLPHDSATVAALRGGAEFRGWTGDRYLLALIADLLQNLVYVQVAKTNPKRKPPKPQPLPRPDDKTGRAGRGDSHKGPSLAEQAADMLRRKRNRELV